MASRKQLIVPVLLGVVGFAPACSACEPIIPLIQLVGGGNFLAPRMILQSTVWLLVAVLIKTVSFACFERRLSWPRAIAFMLAGNILSTIPGVLTAAFSGNGPLIILTIPIIFVLGKQAGRRLCELKQENQNAFWSPTKVALAFTGAYILSVFMFALGTDAGSRGSFAEYWVFKFIFAVLAASVGIMVSTVLEEYSIGKLAKRSHGQLSFFTSVARANYVTLGCILFCAAVYMLPKRMSSPHFFVSWLQAAASAFGWS